MYHWVSRRSVKTFSSEKIKYSFVFKGTNALILPYFPSRAHVSLLIAVQASSLAVNARIYWHSTDFTFYFSTYWKNQNLLDLTGKVKTN